MSHSVSSSRIGSSQIRLIVLPSPIYIVILMVLALALSKRLQGQSSQQLTGQLGTIVGTTISMTGDTVGAANVLLKGLDANDRTPAVTNEHGFFEFHNVKPGVPYHVTVNAEGFAEWTSPVVTIEPSQYKILTDIQLQLAVVQTSVVVTPKSEEVATEQVKMEEKQRVFGIVPNFNVVYDPDPAPLTTRLKFRLALKGSIDPVTLIGIGVLSGVQQAGDTPNYGQGFQGYAKRFGANTTDMIGGAVLPSLLHQDPRYFYQGTGTYKSRIRHAALHPFVCKGDNGIWQPNYSSLGGDLASLAISNAYHPESNRGAGPLFKNFALGTAEHIIGSLVQEFVLHKWTHKLEN